MHYYYCYCYCYRYWDLRQSRSVGTLQLPERVYSMDAVGDLLVAATADRNIALVNLQNPTVVFKVNE